MVKISMLNIGQKIKLYILGNREARTILIKDPKMTPQLSINLIKQLRELDLWNLRWNKNLPGVITTVVKQIMQEKRDKKIKFLHGHPDRSM